MFRFNRKEKGIHASMVSAVEFTRISIFMFKHIIENLIYTGENMWMPYGELVIRRKEQSRAFHMEQHGHGENRVVIKKPILDDWYNVVLWQFKPTSAGVRIILSRKYKRLIKDVLEKNGERFYKTQGNYKEE